MSAHLPRPYQVVPHPWYPLGLPSCVSLRIPGTEETSSLPNTHSMCAGRLPCLDLASAPSSILAWSSPKPTPAPCHPWPCRGAAFLAVDDRLGLALRLGSARLLGRSRDQGGRRGQHRRVSAAAPFLVSISPGLLPPPCWPGGRLIHQPPSACRQSNGRRVTLNHDISTTCSCFIASQSLTPSALPNLCIVPINIFALDKEDILLPSDHHNRLGTQVRPWTESSSPTKSRPRSRPTPWIRDSHSHPTRRPSCRPLSR